MYSEINEWQGNWSRILLEFFVFMVIYTFGSAGAETLLTDANGNVRFGLLIDVGCIIYFAMSLWLFVRYRFTKYCYALENDMIKIYKVLGKSRRLMLNVEKSCIKAVEEYNSKSQFADCGPLLNYCVIDKSRKKYIMALEYEDKKYRLIFQPSPCYLDIISK